MTAYERLKMARKQGRATAVSYIANLFDDFIELKGDKALTDDMSIITGIGTIKGVPVTVIAQEKGTDLESRIAHNFGSPHPEGYRKAIRQMKQAEKFNRPVITIIDTIGAAADIAAEEHGQGFAIAKAIETMLALETPCISIFIGEGGSGGALALACSDAVYMAENSVYSILSPEGFASILWKDEKRAKEACEVMKITAEDLLSLKVIDGIIKESEGGATPKSNEYFKSVEDILAAEITRLKAMDKKTLVKMRYERFRKIDKI
ncbi:MAG: acetyl-CoA carboxylase carboxyl transferase subunit alpha [Clostridia bacterium]|nr:acetyl-CoA carboxylase carboxyl transferase subunit alpha [Clostridia bacterium]